MTWNDEIALLSKALRSLSIRRGPRELESEKGFDLWKEMTIILRIRKGTVYLIGNGASASMASHSAADLAKNARLHTEVFSDLSLITAISNDLGYEHVFEEPLRRRARKGDMLIAISSSGKSPNVLKAVRFAGRLGLDVVTLSAMSPSNPLRRLGTLNVYVRAGTYGDAETCHAAILHHWMDRVVMGT